VRQLTLSKGVCLRILDADDGRLIDGFHDFEWDNGWRWTDGDAGIPEAMFEGMRNAPMLQILLGGGAQYQAGSQAARVA